MPITFTLKTGTTEVNYPAQNTDQNGSFTVRLNGLPPGEPYVWRVKGARNLANSGSSVTPPAGTCSANLEAGLMRAGDANNDNVVSILDFNLLKNTYGKACGDPGYDGRADFNNDCTISIIDFNLLRANIGQSGAPPIRPEGFIGPVKPVGFGTNNAPQNAADAYLQRHLLR